MSGLKGGQGRSAHDVEDTASGMLAVLVWVLSAAVVAVMVMEVL